MYSSDPKTRFYQKLRYNSPLQYISLKRLGQGATLLAGGAVALNIAKRINNRLKKKSDKKSFLG